jgi:ubiquinone/menaquinone biosynthesis C-methylase UbiE
LPEDALRRVGLRPGMRFLDVASGSGALSLPGARLGAQVLAVDLSPAMIERLQVRARQEGLSNIEGRVMDGHALELESDTFDITGSQFGVMLFPDLRRALRELVRVTRPGGRILMVAYGPPGQVEFLTFFTAAMQAVVPDFTGLSMEPPPLPFQLADPENFRREMTGAGLKDVRVEPGVERLEFRTGKELWAWVVNSNPIAGGMVADLTNEQRADLQHILHGMLRERSTGSGPAVLTASVHIGIGTK